ncbi:cytochrome P450 [Thermoflavimicrobium daqui]|nr:cytochrome P450 [Thermoflavimicrobium daqui]
MEAKVAFGTLLRRFPDLKLAIDTDELIYSMNGVVRSIASIPMIF